MPTQAPPDQHAPRPSPLFEVVLHQPEIPNNTGNIGRTCVALGCSLHLIHPLGFQLSEHACRRAGLDYWPRLTLHEHRSWADYRSADPDARTWLFSTKATTPLWDASFQPGDHLVFGSETRGLPDELLDRHPQNTLVLPMIPGERSLNLATAACAVLYEGLRQLASASHVCIVDGLIERKFASLQDLTNEP